jgi:hypothetical protein
MRTILAAITITSLGCTAAHLDAATPTPADATGVGLVPRSAEIDTIPSSLVEIHVEPTDGPPGFASVDEFADIASACVELVPRLVDREDLREPITAWCLSRAYHSSRNGRVRSRIDGSWIHDRDRPAARAFYAQGERSGELDQSTCEHHVVDTSIQRSRHRLRVRSAAPCVGLGPHGGAVQRPRTIDPASDCQPSRPLPIPARTGTAPRCAAAHGHGR